MSRYLITLFYLMSATRIQGTNSLMKHHRYVISPEPFNIQVGMQFNGHSKISCAAICNSVTNCTGFSKVQLDDYRVCSVVLQAAVVTTGGELCYIPEDSVANLAASSSIANSYANSNGSLACPASSVMNEIALPATKDAIVNGTCMDIGNGTDVYSGFQTTITSGHCSAQISGGKRLLAGSVTYVDNGYQIICKKLSIWTVQSTTLVVNVTTGNIGNSALYWLTCPFINSTSLYVLDGINTQGIHNVTSIQCVNISHL